MTQMMTRAGTRHQAAASTGTAWRGMMTRRSPTRGSRCRDLNDRAQPPREACQNLA